MSGFSSPIRSRAQWALYIGLFLWGSALLLTPRRKLTLDGAWFRLAARPGVISIQRVSAFEGSEFVADRGGAYTGGGGGIKITIDAIVNFVVEDSKTISVGDSCLIRSTYHVEHVLRVITTSGRWSLFSEGTEKDEFPPSEALKQEVEHSITRRGLVLAMAGAEVMPPGRNFPNGNVFTWSVKPKGPGLLLGTIIRPEAEPLTQKSISEEQLLDMISDIRLGENITVKIKAVENPFRSTSILSWIPKFLGALLTLPGILAFIREYRQRRDVKRKAEKDEKRIIITGE